MDAAHDAALAGAAEGLVIAAEEQTRGRGRLGRVWSSPAGAGLYLSFVLRPPAAPAGGPLLALLMLAAGVAVHGGILRASGLRAQLKWPNDVMMGRRKLAGILAEGIGIGTADQIVILGLGINVFTASHPGEIAARATSLEAELGRADRAQLLEEVLVAIADAYGQLRRGNAGDILRQWRAAAPSARGSSVEWEAADGLRRGTTRDVDESGALLVMTATGVERIVGGEVRWL